MSTGIALHVGSHADRTSPAKKYLCGAVIRKKKSERRSAAPAAFHRRLSDKWRGRNDSSESRSTKSCGTTDRLLSDNSFGLVASDGAGVESNHHVVESNRINHQCEREGCPTRRGGGRVGRLAGHSFD